jgi:hypothetical protein
MEFSFSYYCTDCCPDNFPFWAAFPYCADHSVRAGLKHEPSSNAHTLGSWVQIPLEVCTSMCAFILCAVLCVGRGLRQANSLTSSAVPFINISALFSM